MHSKSKAMNKNWKLEIIPNYSKVFQNMFETEIQSLLYSSCFITLSHMYIFMLTQHQILQPTFKHPLSNLQETDGERTARSIPQTDCHSFPLLQLHFSHNFFRPQEYRTKQNEENISFPKSV